MTSVFSYRFYDDGEDIGAPKNGIEEGLSWYFGALEKSEREALRSPELNWREKLNRIKREDRVKRWILKNTIEDHYPKNTRGFDEENRGGVRKIEERELEEIRENLIYKEQERRRRVSDVREREIKNAKDDFQKLKNKSCLIVIKEHHEIMKDDPERLSTEFLVDITGCKCGRKKP